MTYGWKRSEVIGGLFNGLFLIALAVFLGLQAVPKFVNPQPTLTSQQDSFYFMIVAGVGIVLNIVGVTLFSDVGHGHSHGGGEHHNEVKEEGGEACSPGHSHSHGEEKESPVDCAHDHGGHGHGHGHGHGSHHEHKNEATAEGEACSASPRHAAAHHIDMHPDNDGNHDRGHGHDHHDHHGHHDHSEHGHVDHNTWGLLIHFIGDVFTSALVCGVGALYYFFVADLVPPHHNQSSSHGQVFDDTFGPVCSSIRSSSISSSSSSSSATSKRWVLYADPVATIISVLVIGYSAWGLIKSCGWVLMQGGPSGMDINQLRSTLCQLKGVHSVHELHVWQLTGSVNIASLHVLMDADPPASGSAAIAYQHPRMLSIMSAIKTVLHQNGVHSSTIQPEFMSEHGAAGGSTLAPVSDGTCALPGGGCVEECETEDSCCTPTMRRRSYMSQIGGGSEGGAYGIN